jgi:hypothetical protein
VTVAVRLFGIVACVLMVAPACRRAVDPSKPAILTIKYDPATGLSKIAADTNHNGVADTWTYTRGTAAVRTEQDLDEDGKIDRWEYHSPEGRVTKIALSSQRNGQADTWMYLDSHGQPARIEISQAANGRVDRWEYYEAGKLVRVALDTDGDGRPDRWEGHDGAETLLWVEVDLNKDGIADEHVIYDAGGRATMTKTDSDGRGGSRKRFPH